MKFDAIKNDNYAAEVIVVPELEAVEGLDNLRALRMYGLQALVGKDVQPGDVGILFPPEVQLSEEFCRQNNLFRHSTLNNNPEVRGYLEDNRRVKAIKFRGNNSNAMFMPLSALVPLGFNPSEFSVGDRFDSIDGKEILRKYVVREPGVFSGPKPKVRRVAIEQFPTHIDTENWWRNYHKIPVGSAVTLTQKLHGTSVRYGKVIVEDESQPWYVRLLKKLGVDVNTQRYRFVVGSRMVIKSIDGDTGEGKDHFYGDQDLWTEYARRHRLEHVIPDGYLIFGELVGKTYDGKEIQKGYTYGFDEPVLYVYRVATVTASGVVTDLSWRAAEQFCAERGLRTVFTMERDMDVEVALDMVEQYMNRNYSSLWRESPPELDRPVFLDPKRVDEGLCIRYDGPHGVYLLKAKAPDFLAFESGQLDSGEADLESEESA